MQFEFVHVEREGPLTIVTLNRPEVLNALHAPAHYELDALFNDFAADPDQWVAILTGAGRAFSTGNDLKYQAAGGRMDRPPSGFAGLAERYDLNKPLIAAVNGVAMGGGLELALCCDIVIADARASFGLPEPRVGMAALAGGMHRLPRVVGLHAAMGMILTGRHVAAEEGRQLGFVNAVVDDGDVMAEARRWAALLLECSPMSLQASKQAVMRGLEEATLGDAMRRQRDYPAMRALFRSNDYVEGPLAFSQKRKPAWTGR